MTNIFEQCTVDGELTPELIKRKQELDDAMEAELADIDAGKGRMWVTKERQFADIRQKYDDIWEQELADAGYVVRPIFESKTRLQEVLNKELASTGLVDNPGVTSIEVIKQDCNEIATGPDLKFFAVQCYAGMLKVLRDSNALAVIDTEKPVKIDILQGGGEIVSNNKDNLKKFSVKKVFTFTVGAGSTRVLISDILADIVHLVDAAGTPDTKTLGALRTIAAYYKRAFERVWLPEVVAARQDAELEKFKTDLTPGYVDGVDTSIAGYWGILGWLTKNVRQIKAIIPERGDFLTTFLSYNADAVEGEGYVVHADGLTSGGFANQFTYMFLVSFTNRVKIPESVATWLSGFGSQVKNPMSCNKLAMTLINNYGFTFGLTDKAAVAETCLAEAHTDAERAEFFAGYGDGAEQLAADIGYTISSAVEDEFDLTFPPPTEEVDPYTSDAGFVED